MKHALLAGLLAAGCCAAAETAVFDRNGRLSSMLYGGDELAGLWGRVQIPSRDWTTMSEPMRPRRGPDRAGYQGTITTTAGKSASFRQTVSEEGGRVWIAVEVTADADLDAAGVYYTIDVPRADFAGGQAVIQTASGPRAAALPAIKPAEREFLRLDGSGVAFTALVHNLNLSVTLDRPRSIALADRWDRAGRTYAALIEMHPGALAAGQTASLKIGVSLTGQPDSTPARLKLDTAVKRYRLQGFGGNYCFNIDSPVTQYTLKNLNVAWARTEMSLSYWEPDDHTSAPAGIGYFKQREQAYPRLRAEMQLSRQIQDKGIPYIMSIWAIPEWLYTDPGPRPQRRSRRHVAPDKWDALVNCIGSYLSYAKQQYGVEPDLFSFNEANLGVDVTMTPEEHRDIIKKLGARFDQLALKTRLLLGDATGLPQNIHNWALAAAADPEAMRYVKALAFHSWSGGTPAQYQAWGDLAEWLQLPLLVTELGVDAQAWQGASFDSFHYGMREVRMYQELLLHARPQGTLQWEFTSDYGTVRARPREDGGVDLVPTSRFWLLKHFTDLTPRDSDALATASDNDKVLFTAFGQGRRYTLHVANTAAARQVTVEGLPDGEYRAVRTGETEDFRELPPMRPEGGLLRIDMPARSLLSLMSAL